MKIIRNTGTDRVIEVIRSWLERGCELDVVTPLLSLFAFAEMRRELRSLDRCRILLPPEDQTVSLWGSTHDRGARNRLQGRWLAKRFGEWISGKCDIRRALAAIPQGAFVLHHGDAQPLQVLTGALAFSTEGLGLTPGNPLNLIQVSETPEEAALLSQWFDLQWSSIPVGSDAKSAVVAELCALASHRDPLLVYAFVLDQLFRDRGEELDEDKIVKAATGIRNTVIWKKLFKFQRDGVVGAIDKLNRFGGCIIDDSVGLGKTFEALAIIKYYELRNDRDLVLWSVLHRPSSNGTAVRVNVPLVAIDPKTTPPVLAEKHRRSVSAA